MSERPDPHDEEIPVEVHLGRIARELKTVRELLGAIAISLSKAEEEIPERMRRFANYVHDVNAICYMYEERGLKVPTHVHREMERCDDRYRHMLEDLHAPGEAFDKVRRDMAARGDNVWDHTRALFAPKGTSNETGPSEQLVNGKHEAGAEIESGSPGVSSESGDAQGKPL